MEAMIETCCGIDVHPKSIVCCILDGSLDSNKPKKIQKKFGTTTVALHNALDWMVQMLSFKQASIIKLWHIVQILNKEYQITSKRTQPYRGGQSF